MEDCPDVGLHHDVSAVMRPTISNFAVLEIYDPHSSSLSPSGTELSPFTQIVTGLMSKTSGVSYVSFCFGSVEFIFV
jgi:hypothetical protein